VNRLSQREHANLARDLIAECGGLEEALRACRLRTKSTLSGYQNPHEPSTMPADVIDALEVYCGKPIYSSALFERFGQAGAVGSLRDSACDLSEQALELQGLIRRAIADDRLTPRELDNLAHAERQAEEALDRVRGARRAAETQRPDLKAV
jgi:hypothetical protein